MFYKYGKRTRDVCGLQSSFLHFGGVFNKTIILLALVGCEMIIANSALRLLVIYALVSYVQSHIQRAFVE